MVKVCDLGLRKRVEQAAGDNALTSINYYSPGYCPPEKLLNYNNHEDIDGYKVDMWCFGELALQALTGEPSFKNAKGLDTWCRTGEGYPDQLLRELEISEGAIDFLYSVMACEPAARPTAEAACEHSWWADLDTRSERKLTPGPSKPDNMLRRSAPEMRLPVKVTEAKQHGWCPQQSPCHDATPHPRWETHNYGRAESTSPRPRPQNEPYWTALSQHPYPIFTSQTPMGTDTSAFRRHFGSDSFTEPYQNSYRPSIVTRPQLTQSNTNRLPYNDSSLALFDRPEALQHWGYNNRGRTGLISRHYNELYEPQQQDHTYGEQAQLMFGSHDRSGGFLRQHRDDEDWVQILPAPKKASPSVRKEPRMALTMKDLTIFTNGEPVKIIMNPGHRNSKNVHQGHSCQAVNQVTAPETSVASKGKGKPSVIHSPRDEHACSHLRTQLRKQQQEEEAARLNSLDGPSYGIWRD